MMKYFFAVVWLIISWIVVNYSFEIITSPSDVGVIVGIMLLAIIIFSNWELGGYTFDDKDDTNLWFKFFNLFKRKEK